MLEHLTQGKLVVPQHAQGLIVFAHGSGSSRLSPRNMFVAERLQQAGFATYLFDLLSEEEDRNPERRFDISLLASRLTQTVRWVSARAECLHLPVGLFGASTGSAAALLASLSLSQVKAIVCRGGRPDLVLDYAASVRVPILLIVGGNDREVLELNQQFFSLLSCIKKISIVPDATHLFEEEGALEQVADLAENWFSSHLRQY